MRVHLKGDLKAEEFSKLLLDIGDGKLPEEDGRINIPDNLCDVVEDLQSLINRIYPTFVGMEVIAIGLEKELF